MAKSKQAQLEAARANVIRLQEADASPKRISTAIRKEDKIFSEIMAEGGNPFMQSVC